MGLKKTQLIEHTQKTDEKMKKTEVKIAKEKTDIAVQRKKCADADCPVHGNLKARGRVFEGKVIRKFHKRIAIEFERMIYIRKYERYARSKTKIHARLPTCMENSVNVGDLVKVQECRHLSKLISFVFIEKVKAGENKK